MLRRGVWRYGRGGASTQSSRFPPRLASLRLAPESGPLNDRPGGVPGAPARLGSRSQRSFHSNPAASLLPAQCPATGFLFSRAGGISAPALAAAVSFDDGERRREGHQLSPDDLKSVLQTKAVS